MIHYLSDTFRNFMNKTPTHKYFSLSNKWASVIKRDSRCYQNLKFNNECQLHATFLLYSIFHSKFASHFVDLICILCILLCTAECFCFYGFVILFLNTLWIFWIFGHNMLSHKIVWSTYKFYLIGSCLVHIMQICLRCLHILRRVTIFSTPYFLKN